MARVELASQAWGWLVDATGHPLANTSATLKNLDGTNATTWTALTGGSSSTAALTSNTDGTLSRFVEAGSYDLTVNALTHRVEAVSGTLATSAGVIVLAPTGTAATDTANFQASLDAASAAGGGVVRPLPGTYSFNAGLTYTGNNLTVAWPPGCVLDFGAASSSQTCIQVSGTAAAAVLLTANAAAGATTLTIAAGAEAGFAVGDWVKVTADTYFAGNPATTSGVDQYIGEQVQILSKASGSLTLRWPLAGGPYNTASNASVSKITPATNIKFTGEGTLRGFSGDDTQVGLSFTRCNRVRVKGIKIEGIAQMGVAFADVVDGVVDGITATAGDHSATLSYGVRFSNACQDCSVVNSRFQDWRHGADCGGSTATPGINRRISYVNNTAVDTQSAGFSVHAGVEDVTITGNRIYGSGADEDSGGIAVRSPRAVVTNNQIRSPQTYGIWLRNQSTKPTQWTVSGNRIENVSTSGILATVTLPTSPQSTQDTAAIAITGNTVYGAPSYGIRAEGHATAGRLNRVAVVGNTIRDAATYAISLSLLDEFAITGNVGTLAAGGIQVIDSTSGSVTGNTMISASSGVGNGLFVSTNTDDVIVAGNLIEDFATGVALSSTTTNCTVGANHTRTCTTPFSPSTGAGHFVFRADTYTARATDADFTLTMASAGVGGTVQTVHTGTLTANRTVTLSTTAAYAGARFKITRTGGGAFNLNVGTGPLKALATNTWCEVTYNGTAWVLTAYGAL